MDRISHRHHSAGSQSKELRLLVGVVLLLVGYATVIVAGVLLAV